MTRAELLRRVDCLTFPRIVVGSRRLATAEGRHDLAGEALDAAGFAVFLELVGGIAGEWREWREGRPN